MYLRISELVLHTRWTPTMGDFFKDSDDNWWFKTIGKGNKVRQIAVSDAMLNALQHYLKLSPLPDLNEKTPLIHNLRNINKSISNEDVIRDLVQTCFDEAAYSLELEGKNDEANGLRMATGALASSYRYI